MKKYLSIFVVILLTTVVFSHKNKSDIQVLYFKAQLCACQAKVCSNVGADIQSIIEKVYSDNSVLFKELLISDATNKDLVTKYKAKSQTTIIVKKRSKKEFSIDISDIVYKFSRDKNKQAFEDSFKSKIVELNKMR